MNNLLHIAALSLALTSSAVLAEDIQTGMRDLNIVDARNDRPLEGFLWYPTADTDGAAPVHSNGVWKGIVAIADAEPVAGKHPFVVLSHGMYGNARNQNWLAEALVAKGFVVAAISHPGTSTWLRDPDQARELWERPKDISRVIDHALSDPVLRAQIDPDRIYMAGHSLGGMTAVALAGGRFDDARVDAFCSAHPDDTGCDVLKLWNVAETPQDVAAMQADLSDPRIKGFGVFDLGATQTFSARSLAAIVRPMLVIAAPLDIGGLNLDVESRALRAALPTGNVTYLEPGTLSHFDFLGVCKPAAVAILAEEEPGDEVICINGQEEREADHALIVEAVVTAFQ